MVRTGIAIGILESSRRLAAMDFPNPNRTAEQSGPQASRWF